MKPLVSIIIVNYKVKKELFACLSSILNSKPKVSYELIVVDNDEQKIIEKDLRKKFPSVIYIKNPRNNGYGGGNNLGAAIAEGNNLFFLNPDTVVKKGAIDELVRFINNDKKIGIVAPLLLKPTGQAYPLQGTKELTPIRGIFALSFINKIFPNNRYSKRFWIKDWDKHSDKEVDVVPGTAFLIRRNIFEKAGKFDENFFLYFEEFDLCKRVKELGYKIFINHSAQVVHIWESSTKQVETNSHFSKSRFLYFRKHFGLIHAIFVQIITEVNKYSLFMFLVLLLAGFLRLYKLDQWMILIGDQGWFYLSARDAILSHTIPLVGIPSSVVWLRQGPLATYLIMIAFLFGNFNPVAPGILFALLDVVTVYLIYNLCKIYFNKTVGLLASAFYATSTLVVVNARMPYHTSAIPLLSTIFFTLTYLVFQKKRNVIFLFFLTLGFLIQLELSNAVLIGVLLILYIFYKPKINKNNFIEGILGFLIGILPFLLYDISHRFVQTLGLPLWIINRTRLFFGLTLNKNSTTVNFPNALRVISEAIGRIIFPSLYFVAAILFFVALIIFIYKLFKVDKNNQFSFVLIVLWIFVPLLSYGIHSTPGSAYFPLIFAPICIMIGYFFWYFSTKFKAMLFVFILLIVYSTFYFFKTSFFTINSDMKILPPYGSFTTGLVLKDQEDIASVIVKDANGSKFQLKGGGFYGIFESNIDNYKYLILYQGGRISGSAKVVYTLYIPSDKIKKNELLLYKSRFIQIAKRTIL